MASRRSSARCAPESAAAKAGLQSGDEIIAIDGKPVANHSQLLQALGPKYEGDTINLRIKRGKEEVNFDKIVLGGVPSAFMTALSSASCRCATMRNWASKCAGSNRRARPTSPASRPAIGS